MNDLGLVTKLQILHQFNDIAREIYVNGAWESWLSDHLVKAMINYPDAVLLGKILVTTHKIKKIIPISSNITNLYNMNCKCCSRCRHWL